MSAINSFPHEIFFLDISLVWPISQTAVKFRDIFSLSRQLVTLNNPISHTTFQIFTNKNYNHRDIWHTSNPNVVKMQVLVPPYKYWWALYDLFTVSYLCLILLQLSFASFQIHCTSVQSVLSPVTSTFILTVMENCWRLIQAGGLHFITQTTGKQVPVIALTTSGVAKGLFTLPWHHEWNELENSV